MLSDKLPSELEEGLLILHRNEYTSINADVIKKLLLMKLISDKYSGGWMLNGNGRAYIREHRLK